MLCLFSFVFGELWYNRKIASKPESSGKEDGNQRKVDKFVHPFHISFMLMSLSLSSAYASVHVECSPGFHSFHSTICLSMFCA